MEITPQQRHHFGGNWTKQKLDILEEYLDRYQVALKNQPFEKWYIDAFAGTGYVETQQRRKPESHPDQTTFMPVEEEPTPEVTRFMAGSAVVALESKPGFDRHVFIEKSAARCAQLEKLRERYQEANIEVREGDANQEIARACEGDWRNRRAVLFLDPYGTQVNWTTIEAIARTKAIDLWALFPVGMGVNRMLTRSGEIPEAWKNRLNELLGTKDWYDRFYQVKETANLFGEIDTTVTKARMEVIGEYFLNRLRGTFAGVSARPALLKNSTGSVLYLLCFAAANPAGAKIAVRIADGILKKMGS